MRVRPAFAAVSILVIAFATSMAQDSTEERRQSMMTLQTRIADLQARVVSAPDDRNILRALLETGFQYYELIDARFRFPDYLRNEIVELKITMQDMYSIQRVVAEMGRPMIDGNALANRLKLIKVPQSGRRSV